MFFIPFCVIHSLSIMELANLNGDIHYHEWKVIRIFEMLWFSGIVFLSVKPEARTAVFAELSKKAFANTPVIISIMGGIDVKTLEKEVRLPKVALEIRC